MIARPPPHEWRFLRVGQKMTAMANRRTEADSVQ